MNRNFEIKIGHCAWCDRPLPPNATSRRYFCNSTCRGEFGTRAEKERKEELEEIKNQARQTRPIEKRKKHKDLSRFPDYFTTHFLPIARGEASVPDDEILFPFETYRDARQLYKDWEAFINATLYHSEMARAHGRTTLAEQLEEDHRNAAGWKIEPRLADGRVLPQCKEDWMAPATARFCPRHKRAVDNTVRDVLEHLEGIRLGRGGNADKASGSVVDPDQDLIDDIFRDI